MRHVRFFGLTTLTIACLGVYKVYGSISEDHPMTSAPPAAAEPASDAINRQTKSASSSRSSGPNQRLRLYGSGGRMLPSVLLGQRRRHTASSLHCRDYSVDKLTDAVYHEFLRHDPQLDVRQSPLTTQQRVSLESVDCVTVHRHGRPLGGVWPLSAHIEESEPDWLSGGSARRTSSNCRSAAAATSRNTNDITTTLRRDST